MQAVYMHEDEGSDSRRTDPISAVICAERVSRHLEGEHARGPRERITRIQISRGILS